MGLLFRLFLACNIMVFSLAAFAKPKFFNESSLGFELGLNSSFLLSGATGLGLGTQWGFHGTHLKSKAWPLRWRLESLAFRQSANSRLSTSDFVAGSFVKFVEQRWWVLSGGAEKRWEGANRVWAWEALIGYGFGQPGELTVERLDIDNQLTSTSSTTPSGFIFSTGLSFRREISADWAYGFGIRTVLPLFVPFADRMSSKGLFVLPFLFSLSLEY